MEDRYGYESDEERVTYGASINIASSYEYGKKDSDYFKCETSEGFRQRIDSYSRIEGIHDKRESDDEEGEQEREKLVPYNISSYKALLAQRKSKKRDLSTTLSETIENVDKPVSSEVTDIFGVSQSNVGIDLFTDGPSTSNDVIRSAPSEKKIRPPLVENVFNSRHIPITRDHPAPRDVDILDRPAHWTASSAKKSYKPVKMGKSVSKTNNADRESFSLNTRLVISQPFSRLSNIQSNKAKSTNNNTPVISSSCQPSWIPSKTISKSSIMETNEPKQNQEPIDDIVELYVDKSTSRPHAPLVVTADLSHKPCVVFSKSDQGTTNSSIYQHPSFSPGPKKSRSNTHKVGSLCWIYSKAIRDVDTLESWTSSLNNSRVSNQSALLSGAHDPRNRCASFMDVEVIQLLPNLAHFNFIVALLNESEQTNQAPGLNSQSAAIYSLIVLKDRTPLPRLVDIGRSHNIIRLYEPVELPTTFMRNNSSIKGLISQQAADITSVILCHSWGYLSE